MAHAPASPFTRVVDGVASAFGEVQRVFLQRLALALGFGTFDLVAATHGFERVILDVKLPGDRPGLFPAFGRAVKRALDRFGLGSRAIVMSPDARVVRGLKPHLPALGSRLWALGDVDSGIEPEADRPRSPKPGA